MGNLKKIATYSVFSYIVLFSIFTIFPLYYMMLTSLKVVDLLVFDLGFTGLTFQNYVSIFKNIDFFSPFLNSIIFSVSACIVNVFVCALAGYGFAKKKFFGKKIIYSIYLGSLMVPGSIISTFILMNEMGILNTFPALFLPTINAFGVFLITQFMLGIPDELIEATQIDGASDFRVFWGLVIPLSKTVILSLMVFTFITTWNDFTWPLVATSDKSMFTLTIALSKLKGSYSANWGLVMAGATLTFLPPFILYLLFQKQVVEGAALSGIKS